MTIQLGAPGRILRAEIDTLHFKGNAPGSCAVEVTDAPDADASALEDASLWRPLLPESPLRPHARCVFEDELARAGRATHARLRIFPDGGVSRFRLWGRSEWSRRLLLVAGRKGALAKEELRAGLLRCCGSGRWVERMMEEA